MKMHQQLSLTAIVAVALAVNGRAQTKDFSGTWNIDQAATDAANAPSTSAGGRLVARPAGSPMTIKQTPDSIIIERRGGDGGAVVATTYKLDGIQRDISTGQGTAKVKAKWDGDKIVIETLRPGQDGTLATTTATYAIDKDGVLWVETKAPRGTSKRAYRRS